MTAVGVFISGEGPNDLGSRFTDPGDGSVPGLLEQLLESVRRDGWRVRDAMPWKAIRKYKAGAGRLGAHNDRHNVLGLIARAYNEHAEILAFLRDLDGDPGRKPAIDAALADRDIRDAFAREYRYELAVIAGLPTPCLEGWVLAMRGLRNTDAMSRAKVLDHIAAQAIEAKRLGAYAEILEDANLADIDAPSLTAFLDRVRTCFASVIDGVP